MRRRRGALGGDPGLGVRSGGVGGERADRGDLAAAGLVSLLALLAQALLAARFDATGAFGYYDILFDTDPVGRLQTFAHGAGERGFIHPILPFIVAMPLRAISALVHGAGLVADPVQFRLAAAVWVVPVLTAPAAGLFLLLLRRLGADRIGALAGGLLYAASFGAVLFGSIPDHFGLSGALIVLLLFVTVRELTGDRVGLAWWGLVGFLLAGVTVTNIGAFMLARLVVERSAGRGLIGVALRAAAFGVALLVLALAASFAWKTVQPAFVGNAAVIIVADAPPLNPNAVRPDWQFPGGRFLSGIVLVVLEHLRTDPVEFVSYLGWSCLALLRAVLPVVPWVFGNWMHGGEASGVMRFSFLQAPQDWLSLAVTLIAAAAILAGALRLLRSHPAGGPLVGFCLLWIGANVLLHGLWGAEPFLYVPHWHGCTMVLVAGLLLPARSALPGRAAAAGLLGLMAVANTTTIAFMLGQLAGLPPA